MGSADGQLLELPLSEWYYNLYCCHEAGTLCVLR